jgi:LysM repeat protein
VPAAPRSVVVQQGDSLWAIAARIAPNQDPRDVVGKLESRNHLRGSTVKVGQILQLP